MCKIGPEPQFKATFKHWEEGDSVSSCHAVSQMWMSKGNVPFSGTK